MSDTSDTLFRVEPTATPGEVEISAWQALPRDEQLRRLRLSLAHPDVGTAGTASMSDILGRAQAAAKLRHG